jgi:hypothetical protein
MSEQTDKMQLLGAFNQAHEQLIATAIQAHQHREASASVWGPREILAHIMGWEAAAIPYTAYLLAGNPPAETDDDSFNAAIITAIGNQSFEDICELLRQTHQRLIAVLSELDETDFAPLHSRRVEAMTHHCLEHAYALRESLFRHAE